jgi:hypothetical protein
MGSYHVSCSVSGLSIKPGDSIVIFLLLPREFSKDEAKQKPILVQAEPYMLEIDHYFNPFCFPISCAYNDCGGVREVEKSENVRSVESFFGLSIKQVVDHVINGETRSKTVKGEVLRVLSNLSLMYVHGDVYKAMITIGFCPWENIKIDIPKLLSEMSKALYDFDGTHKIEWLYTYPSIEKQRQFFELFEDIARGKPGYIPSEFKPEPEGKTTVYDRPGYREDPENDPLRRYEFLFNPLLCFYKGWPYFATLYREAIKSRHLVENFVKYSLFAKRMHSCNKFFFPALTGEQLGNDSASKSLAEVTLAILKKR